MAKIKTFELDRWSEPDEKRRVRHIGMADALAATGFKVIVAVNADRRALDGALRKFTEDLADADVGLFF